MPKRKKEETIQDQDMWFEQALQAAREHTDWESPPEREPLPTAQYRTETVPKRKTGAEIVYGLKRDLYYSYGVPFKEPKEFSSPWNDPKVKVESDPLLHGVAEAVRILERDFAFELAAEPMTAKRKVAKPQLKSLDK
jgi:hypothetical protein